MVLLGSANTDEAEFADADDVRFDREVNRHLAFGGGVHRCLGSHLARQELRIALREWHRRIPEYEVEPGATLEYTGGIRSIEHFPMRLHRRTLTTAQGPRQGSVLLEDASVLDDAAQPSTMTARSGQLAAALRA